MLSVKVKTPGGGGGEGYSVWKKVPPAGKIKLELLENPSLTLLGFSEISKLIQAHFWDFLEMACWYWPDLAK